MTGRNPCGARHLRPQTSRLSRRPQLRRLMGRVGQPRRHPHRDLTRPPLQPLPLDGGRRMGVFHSIMSVRATLVFVRSILALNLKLHPETNIAKLAVTQLPPLKLRLLQHPRQNRMRLRLPQVQRRNGYGPKQHPGTHRRLHRLPRLRQLHP